MILIKDLLSIAYDATALATLDRGATDLTASAENGELLERIESVANERGLTTLTQTIASDRRAEIADLLARHANAADYIDGQAWEAVATWIIDVVRRHVGDVEISA